MLHFYPFRCQLCRARFRAFQAQHHSHTVERREFQRVLVRVPVTLSGDDTQAEAETTDLSVNGCSLRTDVVFPAGVTVQARLRLGEAGDVVVHSAVVLSQHEDRLGLHFTQIAKDDRERLSRYLGRFLRPTGTPSRYAPSEVVLVAVVGAGIILALLLLLSGAAGPPVQ